MLELLNYNILQILIEYTFSNKIEYKLFIYTFSCYVLKNRYGKILKREHLYRTLWQIFRKIIEESNASSIRAPRTTAHIHTHPSY